MEHVLTSLDTASAADKYIKKCWDQGFVVVALSGGLLSFPPDGWFRLIGKAHSHGLKAKPKLSIRFGAGGDTVVASLKAAETSEPSKNANLGRKSINTGIERMMVESEGINENVKSWRTDAIQTILKELLRDSVILEATNPQVF